MLRRSSNYRDVELDALITSVKGQENDKRLHTTPEDWKYKSIKWMCGETFSGRHTAKPQELC